MLRTMWVDKNLEASSLADLEILRNQLAGKLTLLLIGASSLAMWLTLPQEPFPIMAFGLFAGLLGSGIGIHTLAGPHPTLARHLLVGGLTVGLLIAMGLFADPWLPFLGLLLILIGTVLIPGSELAASGAIAGAAAWMVSGDTRAYPLVHLGAALGLGVAVTWLTVRTLYTTLQWSRNMQQRADHLLDQVRDHRAELKRTLKSFETANTLLRRTQRELIAARKQAEDARRMKEQFAANISHELRTPLNLILGFSEMMYLSPEVYGETAGWPPTLRRDVYQIYRSSRHLIEMIDDILDLSLFEMTGFTLNKEPTPLEPLLRDTGAIAADLFRGHPVRLELELAPNLPTLEIDRTRIRQVLLNLLNNARRFTDQGVVRLAAKRAGREVVISVSDTGPGIPADKLPHIFDEFFQVDLSLRRSHQGAGLGLAISKRFVQVHGGSIRVESQEGAGSTFFFTLPLQSSCLNGRPPNRTGKPGSILSEKRVDSVLVVDPDPAVASMIRRRLDKYNVTQIDDERRLAKAVEFYHPRAVVRNVFPGRQSCFDGLPALPVPVIECSLPSQAWLTDNLSVAATLTKPVTAQQLLEQIERLGDLYDILVIDDDRGFSQLAQRILEASGRPFRIRRAYDGQEGLHAMNSRRPDLVLLDLVMPDVDGFQVLQAMKQKPALANIPVVILTATSFVEDALAQGSSQIVIRRSDGLRPGETLSCLQAVANVLEPHYDELSIPGELTTDEKSLPFTHWPATLPTDAAQPEYYSG